MAAATPRTLMPVLPMHKYFPSIMAILGEKNFVLSTFHGEVEMPRNLPELTDG